MHFSELLTVRAKSISRKVERKVKVKITVTCLHFNFTLYRSRASVLRTSFNFLIAFA